MLNNFNTNNSGNQNPPNSPNSNSFTGDYGYDGNQVVDPNDYLINYNEEYKNASPILFRDNVIQQVLSCMIGKFKPNALLIGAAGVGKTKIVEDIARRIENNDPLIPDTLSDSTVYELPLSSIVSGSVYRGDVEKKVEAIIDFATDPKNKAIIFIDEIHMLAGDSQTYTNIAQLLKPALARGNMRVIGATTLQESQDLMDDPAFNRRFTRLIVDEFSQEQTQTILMNMSTEMFNHYEQKIALNDTIIKEVTTIADEYRTIGSHRPDNAITLLDRAMADALINRKILEEKATKENDTNMLAALQASPTILLSKSQLKKTALHLMTGNNQKNETNIDDLKDKLSVIKGQDDTINFMLNVLERDNLNLYPRKKPLTFLFAGNSGVGKSEIAKIIADELTGVPPISLNMTEYNSPASINRIIGSPAGYVGSDSKTELPFDILESNPYQVILLDEFEKCDKAVQRLFMSAFDEGYIKTSKGKLVDFSKSIIIATTNAGYTTDNENTIGFANNNIKKKTEISIKKLSNFFDTELLNRFTAILQFNPITKDLFEEILRAAYETDTKRIKTTHTSYAFLADTLSDTECDKLTKENYKKEFGARPIKRTIQKYIEDIILNNKKNNTNAKIDTTIIDTKNITEELIENNKE